MKKGMLIVISAPAGCGKDTIIEQALAKDKELYYSVSATTRSKRPGEIDGTSYFFKTISEFEDMIKQNQLLEYTCYCGNYYGTPKNAVLNMMEEGRDVILKIEVEGGAKVKEIFPDCVSIFVLPPSIQELRRRLEKRGTEDAETIEKRIQKAINEISYAHRYDYTIINADLDQAVLDLFCVLKAERLKSMRNVDFIKSILS